METKNIHNQESDIFIIYIDNNEQKELKYINDDCSICLEPLVEPDNVIINLKCNHAYHKDCIHEWYNQKTTCPLCIDKISIDGFNIV